MFKIRCNVAPPYMPNICIMRFKLVTRRCTVSYGVPLGLPTLFSTAWLRSWGPVSQKLRNFSGLPRVPQFPLYLCNAEDLKHQTSQSSWCFLHEKHVKRSAFQNKWIQFENWLFRPEKFSGLSRNRPPAATLCQGDTL